MATREIAVPFSDEEITRLTEIAAREETSIPSLVRLRMFGPSEDPITTLALREGARLRGDGDLIELYDRLVQALIIVRERARASSPR